MNSSDNFSSTLFKAIDAKIEWYDTIGLTHLLEDYRAYHSLIVNLCAMLVKKGLLQEDPYKQDKKVTDITIPDESNFLDQDKALILGIRLSEYETSLDYLCNYFKFSIATLTIERLSKLSHLNKYFIWSALVPTSQNPNTRTLAEICTSIRNSSDTMAIKVLNDFVTTAQKTISKINLFLKDFLDFQKEVYKAQIRKAVMSHPAYLKEDPKDSHAQQILLKKTFPAVMGKAHYYTELIEQISKEDFAHDKNVLQAAVLEKLVVKHEKKIHKVKSVDPKIMLMESVRILASITSQLDQVIRKITDNHGVLENQNTGFWERFATLLRKTFNMDPKTIQYKVAVEDTLTHIKHQENLEYNAFVEGLAKRTRVYNSFAIKTSPGYMKIEEMPEKEIVEYVTKQIAECNKTITILEALNAFFKQAVKEEYASKVSNWTMEITSMKNTLVKANQRKSEYTSVMEEQEQLKKLGITDE